MGITAVCFWDKILKSVDYPHSNSKQSTIVRHIIHALLAGSNDLRPSRFSKQL